MHNTRLLLLTAFAIPLLGCPDDGGDDDGSNSTGTTGDADGTSTGMMTGTPGTDSGSTGDPDTGTTAMMESTGDPDTGTTAMMGSTDESSGSDSGSDSTGQGAGMPDLDMSVVADATAKSIVTQTLNFTEESCEYVEACVGGTGQRRLLRFDTITPNLGDADFHVGNPTDNPELFEFSKCNGTYLFSDYAEYRLLDDEGNEVGTGHKSAFALIDLAPWTDDAGPGQYGFGEDMGISVGWADIYDSGLPCQWVDITGVEAGDYTLRFIINGEQVVDEATFDNNILDLPVTITETDDIEPPPKGWTCDPSYFGTDDGCDCGCGVFDPDCPAMTSDVCMFCDGPGYCGASCDDIDPLDNAVCQ